MMPSVSALPILCVILSCHYAIVTAQSDPLCGDCEYRMCTYEKALSCSCSGSGNGSVTISGFIDQEYNRVSLGFAIDDTGSMSGVINAVKSTIQTVVLATSIIFDKFVLGTFNDPYNLTLIESSDTVTITNFVNAIHAHDGGDCPEMALAGIRDVANRVTIGSAIFVFTDASAKDLDLEASVKTLLLSKDIRLNVIAVGSLCGGGMGGELYRLANATGGSVYYTPSQYDVQFVMNYIAKYARHGVRYIRGIPRSLDDLKALVNGNCSCTTGAIRNLACASPPPAWRSTTTSTAMFPTNVTTTPAVENVTAVTSAGFQLSAGGRLWVLMLLLGWAYSQGSF